MPSTLHPWVHRSHDYWPNGTSNAFCNYCGLEDRHPLLCSPCMCSPWVDMYYRVRRVRSLGARCGACLTALSLAVSFFLSGFLPVGDWHFPMLGVLLLTQLLMIVVGWRGLW